VAPGFYNVFIYGQEGTWGNRGTLFTYNGVFQTNALPVLNTSFANQGGPTYPNLDLSYALGVNYCIFTNIFCTNGTISFTTGPYNSSPMFCGMQVQFISPYQDLAVKQTGTNAVITWAGGTLVSGPTVAGPWTPVSIPTATNYVVPGTAPNTALFYRMQLGPVPAIPPQ